MKTVDAGGVGRFAPGERVAFFGDSITHAGRYVGYLQLFASLRHPGWNVRCLNAGLSGDTAAGAIGRWTWDVLAARPDRVFCMFGMNDVGRDSYRTEPPTEAVAKARAASLAHYDASQRRLAGMIADAGVKAVLVTPSPFDQYSDVNRDNRVSCNEPGLANCAKIVRALAAERNLGTVDFHAKMTELVRKHPELHLCGGDRVHPGAAGHLLMATLVLEEMGEPALVAQVSIDAQKGVADKLADGRTRNAVVTALAATPQEVRFTYAPKALPLPALPEYAAVDGIYPLTARFNQETIRIAGLEKGTYDLAFDGVKVGSFTADEFARGVNVATLDTPNQRLAKAVAGLVGKLVAVENDRRMLAIAYRDFRAAGVSLTDEAAQDAWWEKRLAKLKADKVPWYDGQVHVRSVFQKNRSRAREFETTADDLRERINAVRPLGSRVSVTRH